MKAYHFLRADMTAGSGDEPPWKVGESRTFKGVIKLCASGYHSSPTLWDALQYAPGPVACLVEVSRPVDDGLWALVIAAVTGLITWLVTVVTNRQRLTDHIKDDDKQVSRTRKLIKAVNIERELRLFAADCAERVLPIYEQAYPNDDRPRKAIQVARDLANGKIGAEQLVAAWAAEWDVQAAARAAQAAAGAAGAAAQAAEAAARDTRAAAWAAEAAAWAVAAATQTATWNTRATTRAAARAAGATEAKWQRKYLDEMWQTKLNELKPLTTPFHNQKGRTKCR